MTTTNMFLNFGGKWDQARAAMVKARALARVWEGSS